MLKDAPIAPIASLLRVERGVAAPEELAAIAVVVACFARRNRSEAQRAPAETARRRRSAHHGSGCWAGCWACG